MTNPDLYRALRGGGNNFGIVTGVTIAIFPWSESHYTFKQWNWIARTGAFRALEQDTLDMPTGVSMIAATIARHPTSRDFGISERYVADADNRSTTTVRDVERRDKQSEFWKQPWRCNASDTETLRQMFKSLIGRSKAAAKRLGWLHRFIFQNHAFEDEDAFAGYGEENLRRLRGIRRRVDPEGVFQRLQPG